LAKANSNDFLLIAIRFIWWSND